MGEYGRGYYFADNKNIARMFGERDGTESARLMKVHLALKNPLIVDVMSGGRDKVRAMGQKQIIRYGYDGIIATGSNGYSKQYVVFSPLQIKSADPVTYDDQKQVIPLSARFSTSSNDVRH